MASSRGFRVRRCAVPAEPASADATHDYVDMFEVELDGSDAHTPEEWVRVAVEQGPVARLIPLVHGRVLRFQLADPGPSVILGWRIVASSPDLLHIATSGPLARADIVARSPSSMRRTLTTLVRYERPLARAVWVFVGPLHRRVAPYLLRRAARTFSVREGAQA